MYDFVLTNLVSLLLLKVSLCSLDPLDPKVLNSLFLQFLWNTNPYKEEFRTMSYEVNAADRLVCGDAMFVGCLVIIPSQGNLATIAIRWCFFT